MPNPRSQYPMIKASPAAHNPISIVSQPCRHQELTDQRLLNVPMAKKVRAEHMRAAVNAEGMFSRKGNKGTEPHSMNARNV